MSYTYMTRRDTFLLRAYRGASGASKVRRVPCREGVEDLIRRRIKRGESVFMLQQFVLFVSIPLELGESKRLLSPPPNYAVHACTSYGS